MTNRPEWGIWIAKRDWVRFGRISSGFWRWCCERAIKYKILVGGVEVRRGCAGHWWLRFFRQRPREERLVEAHVLGTCAMGKTENQHESQPLLRIDMGCWQLPPISPTTSYARRLCPVLSQWRVSQTVSEGDLHARFYGISHSYTSIRACTSGQNKQQLSSFLAERA